MSENVMQTAKTQLFGSDWTKGSMWKHLKTGHVYAVIGSCRLEKTGEPAVLYTRPDDGIVWARVMDEFLDGRFERLSF